MDKNEENFLLPIFSGEVVDESKLPNIIKGSVDKIKELEANVKVAMEAARIAKESADNAYRASTKIGHKKAAIESLQGATSDLAQAQVSMADAQKISFEYQQKLGEITKYLFSLGVSSLTNTRLVMHHLELVLEDGSVSKEKLSELAQTELLNVVKQLKAQEDILAKQDFLAKETKQLSATVSEIKGKDLEQDQQLLEQAEKTEELDLLLTENVEKDEQQDRLIKEGVQKDVEQDRLIEEQAKKDEEHDRLIAEQAKKDEEHDRLLRERAEKDELHDQLFAQQAEALQRQEEKINALESEVKSLKAELSEKPGKLMGYIATGVAALAAILSIIQFIL